MNIRMSIGFRLSVKHSIISDELSKFTRNRGPWDTDMQPLCVCVCAFIVKSFQSENIYE